jgi:O-acetylserine/cysteine efflux transporter
VQPRHVALAILVAFIWGLNFVLIDVALVSFPPILLAALRFVLASLPVLFLPRPKVPWRRMVAIGSTLFVGQYALLFTGMANGMPPGLASIILQIQVFLTILIAALALREWPSGRQLGGSILALAGLALVAATAGGADVTIVGLALTLLSALSWSVGNVLLRSAGKVDMLAMISWLSLVPPLPLLALSLLTEGPARVTEALAHPALPSVLALAYTAFLSTSIAFAGWGQLLKLYPAATAAPFALLVPIFGTLAAALFVGEHFAALRLAGMALIFIGLAAIALPRSLFRVPGIGRA